MKTSIFGIEKFIFRITSFVRAKWVLAVIKRLHRYRLLKLLEMCWDPGVIRKYVNVCMKENRALIKFENYRLWVDLNDHIGYSTYVRNQPFEMAVYNLAKIMKLSSKDTILDIGANIGTASVPVCVELGCELVAVEASKGNGDLLVKNIFENRLRAKVHLLALVSDQESSDYLPFYLNPGNTGANSLFESWNPSKTRVPDEFVPVATLDELIDKKLMSTIKLAKIDVEGAEAEVLRGATRFLESSQAVILMEYRIDGALKYLGKDMSDSISILKSTHTLRALSSQGAIEEFNENESYENIIAIPKHLEKDILPLLKGGR